VEEDQFESSNDDPSKSDSKSGDESVKPDLDENSADSSSSTGSIRSNANKFLDAIIDEINPDVDDADETFRNNFKWAGMLNILEKTDIHKFARGEKNLQQKLGKSLKLTVGDSVFTAQDPLRYDDILKLLLQSNAEKSAYTYEINPVDSNTNGSVSINIDLFLKLFFDADSLNVGSEDGEEEEEPSL